jgi:hypothetical protein
VQVALAVVGQGAQVQALLVLLVQMQQITQVVAVVALEEITLSPKINPPVARVGLAL